MTNTFNFWTSEKHSGKTIDLDLEQLGFQQTQVPSLEQVGARGDPLGRKQDSLRNLGSKRGPHSLEDAE